MDRLVVRLKALGAEAVAVVAVVAAAGGGDNQWGPHEIQECSGPDVCRVLLS
jgi:hypothetical protein